MKRANLQWKTTAYVCLLCIMGLHGGPLAASEFRYTIKPGDNLTSIARKHGITIDELAQYNGIKTSALLRSGSTLKIPPTFTTITVKSGDTLSEIAARHSLPIASLQAYNNLKNADRLSVGQELKVPIKPVKPPKFNPPPSLPSTLVRNLQGVRVKTWKWKNIVVHHSASKVGSAKAFDRYHREERNMENGMAYHFVIGNGRGMRDGDIAIGNRWYKQIKGGHLASTSQNEDSIGICLVGNFNQTKPTRKQMRSLEALSAYLMKRCKIKIYGLRSHQEINIKPTQCPGTYLSVSRLRATLKAYDINGYQTAQR